MADDSDLERTEPGSAKRIGEARNQGQVPRSREWAMFAVVLAAGASLSLMSDQIMQSMMHIMRQGLTIERAQVFDPSLLFTQLFDFTISALITFAPFVLVMMLSAIIAPLMIGGWNFATDGMIPSLGKLNPLPGLAKMVSLQVWVELFKAVLKTFLVGGIGVWLVWRQKEVLLSLMGESLSTAVSHLGALLMSTFYSLIWAFVILVAIDIPYQLWNYYRHLRMTKDEVKQEAKDSEGNPQIKARVRSMQREAARKRMMSQVPKANVIIRNPTHFAVALRYEENNNRAPVVIAKGANIIAERICEIATENRVPILRIPPLARALYAHTEIGEEIPNSLFNAVAQVLAYVYQLKAYFNAKGSAIRPELPSDITVPKELDPATNETKSLLKNESESEALVL